MELAGIVLQAGSGANTLCRSFHIKPALLTSTAPSVSSSRCFKIFTKASYAQQLQLLAINRRREARAFTLVLRGHFTPYSIEIAIYKPSLNFPQAHITPQPRPDSIRMCTESFASTTSVATPLADPPVSIPYIHPFPPSFLPLHLKQQASWNDLN